jgi:glycine amidinotransferase
MGDIKINSWNEWDPLKRIIVGRVDGRMIQAPEPAWSYEWPEYGYPKGVYGPFPEEMEEKAKEQMQNFVDLLRSEGVTVDRPEPMDFSQTVETPDWTQDSMVSCMPPRDLLLPVGNEILEATMSKRSRWFEFICYRPILEKYFKEDPDFRWEAAPKPRLTDQSYKDDYWKEKMKMSEEEQIEKLTKNKDFVITEKEPLFDAADVTRLGKDLFVQRSMTTNGAGIKWLDQHFPDLRVHEILFRDTHPRHMDATFIPVKPKLALINKDRPPLTDEFTELLERNGWDLIESADWYHDEPVKLNKSGLALSLNTLMLDPDTVMVLEKEKEQIKQFRDLGLDVIPVPFWDAAPFGGALHCATADVHREGEREDYFPNQIEGY